ncbi:MAG: response regulator [Sphingobacteriaceae bacterium]|nr:MAG: response regulator [Sphingobacteriaceae bacterium]
MQTVLVIDDDMGVLEVVEAILSYEGYTVIPLTFCKNILNSVHQYHPDLVIMDYFLQGVSGGALCRILKETAETAPLPVLLYFAYPNIENSLDHFGCDAFLAKPFDIAELILKVRTLLLQTF